MRLTSLFIFPIEKSRSITFLDLLIVASATFVCLPLLSLGLGVVASWFPVASLATWNPALFFYAFAYTGLFAWLAAPIALGVSWIATRTGWIGPLSAPLFGAAGGALVSLVLVLDRDIRDFGLDFLGFVAFVSGVAILYAGIAWLVLRWLRRDAFAIERPVPPES